MFFARFLTAAALVAAFLWVLFRLGAPGLSLVIASIVGLGGYEWSRLSGVRLAGAYAYAGGCALASLALAQIDSAAVWIAALAGVFWVAFAPYFLRRGLRPVPAGWSLALGLVVLVPAGLAVTAMSPRLVLLTLGLVWIADTAAYLAGSAFGRRKLAPAISPSKTWEGVAGGAMASLIYAIICAMFTPDLVGRVEGAIWVPFLAGALLLFALSVVGDLFESALKRRAGVKDSGSLLPGHGGMLDRIDSATATLPAALLLLRAAGFA